MNLDRRGWGRVALAAFATALASASAGACTQVLGINADRHLVDTTDDTGSPMPEASDLGDAGAEDAAPEAAIEAGPWDCLDDPPEMPDPSKKVDVQIVVTDAIMPSARASQFDGGSDLDIVSGTYLSNVAVTECPTLLTPTCSTPVVTNDAGAAHFLLPGDFNGYFHLDRSDELPYTFYPGQLPVGPTTAELPVALVSRVEANFIVAELKIAAPSFDAGSGLGIIFISVYDCHDHFVPGVQFTISNPLPGATQGFYATGNPSSPSISTTATQTDKVGAAGFVNVPAGSTTVFATVPALHQQIGQVTVAVTPASVSQVWFRPRTH